MHRLNTTITNNTVVITDPNAFDGVRVSSGTPGTDLGETCANISGNNSSVPTGNDFYIRPRFGTTLRLPGYTGGATDTAVQNYLDNTKANNATGQPAAIGFFLRRARAFLPTLQAERNAHSRLCHQLHSLLRKQQPIKVMVLITI